jgi:long-chain acyl-CoA synthetase
MTGTVLFPLADLDRHAAEQPDTVAIATPRGTLTFAELRDAVLAIARRLRHAGVTPGDLVGVDLPTGLEWIVDLALFHLAARTVSLRGVSDPGPLALGVLLTEPGRRSEPARRIIEVDYRWVTEPWIDGSRAAPRDEPAAEFASSDAIFRYLLTSGTTGTPQAAAYSIRAFEYRVAEGGAHWTDGRPELTMIGLSTTGGFHTAVAALRLGIPYLAIDSIDAETMAFAAGQGIQVLCGSPMQVAHAVHVLVEAELTLPDLTEVRLAGATPSTRLLEFIAATLGVPVRGVYGSTEGGGVSQAWYGSRGDRFDVGVPLPGVELQVVDADGRPLPAKTEGAVRYRTPGLVSGYLVDRELVPLPDGWFLPGDRGSLTGTGSLVLAGRDSELFNVGGVKIDPVKIDELAAAFPGVLDAAAFGLERHAGIPEVGLAVVTDASCDLRQLDRELRERMPAGYPTAYWRLDAIPRTRLGKAQRAKLTEDYERGLARRG